MVPFVYRSADQRRILPVFRELVRARQLLLDLVWKDLRARYRYAVMGFLWAVIEPLALMLVLTFIFTFIFRGRVDAVSGAETPSFAVMLLCGLIFWQFFSTALNSAAQCLISNQNLVKKVHFTRETVPLAATGFPLVNLGIGFILLLGVHLLLGGRLGLALLWFPVIFSVQFMLVAGLALLFSSGNVLFRDIGYMVNVGTVFGFYATPVFYPLEFVTAPARVPAWAAAWYPWLVRIYMLNPMAGLVTAYRQILFELRFPDPGLLVWPVLSGAAVLSIGIVVFRRLGPVLSDHL
jgi:lipopolysaccharide transport system permease protein